MAGAQAALLLLLVACCGFVSASPLLGSKQCTWGPSYWCSNITNAKGCGAVKHCITSVWEKQIVPVDTDDVCKICVDMVKQARDQLESNETQQDLKDVFEGSCKFIPIKIIANECISLVDDFIPELVDTLASQMDPQVVCSVAGLCNNERIDKLLAEHAADQLKLEKSKNVQLCNGCHTVVGKMRNNFDKISYEKFLENSLRVCRKMGSFSDACSTAVFSHYEDLYAHLKDNLHADNVCHVAGTCTYKFHQHEPESTSIEITPMGSVGRLEVEGDDTPCKLCEQLVIHARDIIIANTTQEEFKRVLVGLCKQSGSFSSQCLSIVNEYYSYIYTFLVKELDPNAVCFLIGICPKGVQVDEPIAPLISGNVANLALKIMNKPSEEMLIGRDEAKSYEPTNPKKSQSNVKIEHPELIQLPIERMTIQLPQSSEVCTFCQYFLHYVQTQISDAHNEEAIKQVVEKACKYLPTSVESQCESFIEAYGNSVIALLVQEIDPSQVCPAITLCPSEKDLPKIEVLMKTGSDSKPNCPLCLFAVEQLESMLKTNRTKASIEQALETLCTYLPSKLRPECSDFVDTYSRELIEMLLTEFTPQEVCVYLKLCEDNKPDVSMFDKPTVSRIDHFHQNKHLMGDRNNFRKPMLPSSMLEKTYDVGKLIATNEIPDDTFNGKPLIYAEATSTVESTPQCVICEFIMSQIDKQLKDKATDDEIKKIVHSVCKILPKNVKQECDDFVEKYADLVITLLVQELSPAEVCNAINICNDKKNAVEVSIFECTICKQMVVILERLLKNKNVDHSIEHLMQKTCYALPGKYLDRCLNIMKVYGESMINLIVNFVDGGKVCGEVGICGTEGHSYVEFVDDTNTSRTKRSAEQLLGAKKCTWGPGYWCKNEEQANECHALQHCRERVWKADKPPTNA